MILQIQRLTQPLSGFEREWTSYIEQDVPPAYHLKNVAKEKEQLPQIQSVLMDPLVAGASDALPETPAVSEPNIARPDPKGSPTEKAVTVFTNALKSNNMPALRYVAYSLDLDMSGPETKSNYAAKLTAWVSLVMSIPSILRL